MENEQGELNELEEEVAKSLIKQELISHNMNDEFDSNLTVGEHVADQVATFGLAAMQAPIIMISQNRQESKDRLRSEHDYKVNLKAELEIHHLNEKLDHLINQQWQNLLETQQIQLEMLEELMGKRQTRSDDHI